MLTCAIASAQEEQESITLSTYYPAPYGEYDELAAEKLLIWSPISSELAAMQLGDCHIGYSLIVGKGGDEGDFSYGEIGTGQLGDGEVLIKDRLGIGTTAPVGKLYVVDNEIPGNGIDDDGDGLPDETDGLMVFTTTGNVGIGTTGPNYPLEMGSGAHVTTGGVWTDSSSIEYKQDIAPLALDEAVEALGGLNPIKFRFKIALEEKHVGFIAEEVPELVATKDRKGLSPMDIVAVLTKVVKQQQAEIKELKAKTESLLGK